MSKNEKIYYIEPESGEEVVKTLKESEIHESVFEENIDLEAKDGDIFLKAVYSWIAPEFVQHAKSARWWVWAGIIFVIAVVLEAVTGNWTMLLATVVFGVVYWYMHEHHPPRHTKVVISEAGIKIGHNRFAFSEIEKFWVVYEPPQVKKLYFRVKGKLFPDHIIELDNQDPVAIREFLANFVEEVPDQKEKFSDSILRALNL